MIPPLQTRATEPAKSFPAIGPLKITALRTHVVDAFRANFVFVVLETDAGIRGVGEGTLEMRERAVATMIEECGRLLIGQDPFAVDHHVEMLLRDSYWRTGPMLRSALSALEAAMLDIKGKALGVPVYELLGGAHRTRVPCYANAWFSGAREPDDFARKAEAALELGFRALKWDPFGTAWMQMDTAARRRSISIVKAVRAAVGDDVDLMIEGHGRLDVPTAVAMANELAIFKPTWFEEPIPPDNIDAMAEVKARSPIPIATGERLYEPQKFQELLQKQAADILQPDVCHVGGLGETKRIAWLANLAFKPIAPHNPMGPVGNAMTLHLAAAIPNFMILETMATDVPWRAEIVPTEDLTLEDGWMNIPDRPGLGIDIDEAACARHPYRTYDLRHYKGTLTDIRPTKATPFFHVRRSR
jgi:galactonate dehydratase